MCCRVRAQTGLDATARQVAMAQDKLHRLQEHQQRCIASQQLSLDRLQHDAKQRIDFCLSLSDKVAGFTSQLEVHLSACPVNQICPDDC